MQKTKRKNEENNSASPKKKKVAFVKEDLENKQGKVSQKKFNSGDKTKEKFSKDGPKENTPKGKFNKGGFKNKNSGDKPKGNFNKDSPHGKKPFTKPGNNIKGKPGFKFDKKGNTNKFSKDQPSTEKPVWSEMKKEKKELRIVRRKAKATPEVFEISHKAKLLAAQIQRKVVKPEFRENACKELHGILKGQYKNIALTHDLSRVIQVLLKHSPEKIRHELSEEVLDIFVQMVQSKYGHHAAKRILKYGTDAIRSAVINKFYGHIVTLSAHSISAPILDYAYGEFATQKQKLHMQQEFYGDIYKNTKDDLVKTLSDSYKDSPGMKSAILSSCKANIQRILDKNLHDGELLHAVLLDYLRECGAEERAELVGALSPLIVPLSNSLPGADAAALCVWHGTNKDKKTILKVVKEHAVPLSTHRTGHRLLLAIFAAVDDTVLVRRALVAALVPTVRDVAKDHWGRMTLHWLVKPNDTAAFHPNLIKFLNEGAKSGTSKKDNDIRVSELREAILPALLKELESEPEFWMSDPTITLLTTAILSIESTQPALEALAGVICRPEWTVKRDEKDVVAVEDAGMHMCLKKLAALDKDRTEGGLGEAIAGSLEAGTLEVWLKTNRGCFFLVKLVESNTDSVTKKLIAKIKPSIGTLKKQTTPGAKLLLKKVENK